ncbi:hypothetical protein ACH42_02225 [Endozoicomonas sp. (ex Bugula neritina AB1)]|nr:hypothetical protein ACH42_02225 [Endozoicomonas sp. (ex Bugula neritina AB1)]
MSETEQDLQRRELIFKVLDELKSKGERINGDKVARLAKMGKQTVLPYYKEWRFLDDVDREQGNDIPEELIRSLKRGIARWKHELSAESQSFEEQANSEIDALKQANQSLTNENSEKNLLITQLRSELADTQSQLVEVTTSEQEQKQALAILQLHSASEQEKSDNLTQQLRTQKEESIKTAAELEQRLDLRHQEQLNHWLKVVDDERRLKQELEKGLILQKELQLKIEKEKNEISHRLDSKNRAYMDACEERNQLKSDYKAIQPSYKIFQQSLLLLDCEPEALISKVRALIAAEQHCSNLTAQLDQHKRDSVSLSNALSAAEGKLSHMSDIEKQLEKTRGYAKALEKTAIAIDNKEG